MLDIGAWAEVILILILAVVIISPKDLPKVLHTLGHWAGKIKLFVLEAQSIMTAFMHQPLDHAPLTAEDEEKPQQAHTTPNHHKKSSSDH